MARSTVVLTTSYQKIADMRCRITVKSALPTAKIFFNDSDTTDNQDEQLVYPNITFIQDENKATYAKGANITVLVEESAV